MDSRPQFNYANDLFQSFSAVHERQKKQSEITSFALKAYTNFSKANGTYAKQLEKFVGDLTEPEYKEDRIFPVREIIAVLQALSTAANQLQDKLQTVIIPALTESDKVSKSEITAVGKNYSASQAKTNTCRINQQKAEQKSKTAFETFHAAEQTAAEGAGLPNAPKLEAASNKARLNAEKLDADLHSAVDTANAAEEALDESIKNGLSRMEDIEWSRLEKFRTTSSEFASIITAYATTLSGAADNLSFVSSGLAPENFMEDFRSENCRGVQSNKITNYICQDAAAPAHAAPVESMGEPAAMPNMQYAPEPMVETVSEPVANYEEPKIENNYAADEEF